jgi:MYXO-CTERM domain-containing protein
MSLASSAEKSSRPAAVPRIGYVEVLARVGGFMAFWTRVVVWGCFVGVQGLAGSRIAWAQQTEGCPLAASEYGYDVEKIFTDSQGRSTDLFLHMPPGHDPNVATGILMYFHGNDIDPDDSYVAPLYELQERADAHGLIALGVKSIGTTINESDGTVRREFVEADSLLLRELLSSDLGGCLKLDRSRVFLEGASQGTCFLSANLTQWLPLDFQGGVIGLCGCWGTGHFDYPVNIPAIRSRFKVFVENTTEDFLHSQGVMGHDVYKYNFGSDVRADLGRPGLHCENSRENAAAALDWMAGGATLADPDANQPHWQMVNSRHNGLEEISYDAAGERFVLAVQRADVTDETIEAIDRVHRTMFVDDPQGFLDWRLENYPEYAVPPVLIYETADYGASFTKLGRRESTGDANLRDMTVAPDGSILVTVGIGLLKVNASTQTIDPYAFPDMLVYGLDRDASGNIFAHGAVIHLQRSSDSGVTWTELTVPVKNQYNDWTVHFAGGTLAVIGSDGMVYLSQDSGDQFTPAALPAETLVDFANHGQTLYAVTQEGVVQVSADAGVSWQISETPGPARALEALPNGDVVISTEPVAYDVGLVYRSSDTGATWVRERGAHNDARMAFAFGSVDQRMMVTTRGTFRYSTGAPLDLGTEPPPIGGSSAGGSAGTSGNSSGGNGGGGQAGQGVAGDSGGGASGGTTGNGGAGAGGGTGGSPPNADDEPSDDGGCGCRTSPARPASAYGLASLALVWLLRRRRAGQSLT